ncbi:MAG: TRAP transporter small permease subunit [Rhodoferax sp.]|nr:TRAP transporter small permease subunit [Rhodoferax sp.]
MNSARVIKFLNILMAACLAVMAASVFVNVVLRYGFGSGVAASEELSRLLFVWMVFIGATAAYPQGEHMAFTSLLHPLLKPGREGALKVATCLIHALVVISCALVSWGAWQQVLVGMDSVSVVLGYRQALLPLPAFLCSLAIGLMALWQLLRARPIDFGHAAEVE